MVMVIPSQYSGYRMENDGCTLAEGIVAAGAMAGIEINRSNLWTVLWSSTSADHFDVGGLPPAADRPAGLSWTGLSMTGRASPGPDIKRRSPRRRPGTALRLLLAAVCRVCRFCSLETCQNLVAAHLKHITHNNIEAFCSFRAAVYATVSDSD